MSTKKLLLVLLFLCILNSFSAYAITYNGIAWNATVNTTNVDTAQGVAVDSSNNVIVTGTINANYFTIAYDSNGNQVWNATDDPGTGIDAGRAVATDSADNVIVTGYGGAGGDYYTYKHNSTGGLVWGPIIYNGGGLDYAYGVATDSANNVIVTGAANNNYGTVKYNSSGSQQWAKTYDNGGLDYAREVAIDSLDNIIVTGYSFNASGGGFTDFFTIKYNSSGGHIWNRTYDSGNNDYAYGVAVDSYDNVIVTGYSTVVGGSNYFIIKYDENGNHLWNKSINRAANDLDQGVAVDASNNIFTTGYSGVPGAYDYYTLGYDSQGNQFWSQIFTAGDDLATGIAVDSMNDVLVTGYSDSVSPSGNDDYFTLKYNFSVITGCPTTITSDTALVKNHTAAGNCLRVNTSNIFLDCQGNTITGSQVAGSYGILLDNVTNVSLRNCAVTNFTYGIILQTSDTNFLFNNYAYQNIRVGFDAFGIFLNFSDNNILLENTASRNDKSGFELYESNNNNLTKNHADFNDDWGIFLNRNNDNNFFINNTITRTKFFSGFGVDSHGGSNDFNVIKYNRAYNNSGTGFFIRLMDFSNITENLAYNNSGNGFILQSNADRNNISNNTAYDNFGEGFDCSSADRNNITNNLAYNNRWGFEFFSCDRNRIFNNRAYKNNNGGFRSFNEFANNFIYNTAYDNSNGSGFALYASGTGTIMINNSAYNNTGNGFYFDSFIPFGTELVHNNTAYNNSDDGFEFYDCDQMNITDNTAFYNGMHGVNIHAPPPAPTCPFLYAWNGTNQTIVNDIYPQSMTFLLDFVPRLIDTSYVKPRFDLVPNGGYYEANIREERNEIAYTDYVYLMTIDHPQSTEIYPSYWYNKSKLYSASVNLTAPVSCVDNKGNDCLAVIRDADYDVQKMREDDYMVIDLGDLSNASHIQLVIDRAYAGMQVIQRLDVVAANGSWVRINPIMLQPTPVIFNTKAFPGMNVLNLTGLFLTNNYTIRIYSQDFPVFGIDYPEKAAIDFIGVDTSAPNSNYTVNILAPVYADLHPGKIQRLWNYQSIFERPGYALPQYNNPFERLITYTPAKRANWGATQYGDVLSKITTDGCNVSNLFNCSNHVVTIPGDEITLRYNYTPPPPGMVRDFIFISNGAYTPKAIFSGSNLSVKNNLIFNNSGHGVFINNTDNEFVINNTITSNNGSGIALLDANFINVTNNTVLNHVYSINLTNSSNDNIYNNYFGDLPLADAASTNNNWNIAKTAGTNIIGGPFLGGNYWDNYNGTDTDGDGLGNTFLPWQGLNNGIVNGGDNNPLVTIYVKDIECEFNNSGVFLDCDNATYFANITRVRVNCTPANGIVINAIFNLTNLFDANTFFVNTTTNLVGGYYVLDNPDVQILDSGNWSLTATCTNASGVTQSGQDIFFIPFGTVLGSILTPAADITVNNSDTFNVTCQMQCTGGECVNVNATLDPFNPATNLTQPTQQVHAVYADSQFIYGASNDGAFYVWNKTGLGLFAAINTSMPLRSIFADSQYIYAGGIFGINGNLSVYNRTDLVTPFASVINISFPGGVFGVKSDDNYIYAAGGTIGGPRQLTVYNKSTFASVANITFSDQVRGIDVDSERIYTVSHGCEVNITNITGFTPITSLAVPANCAQTKAISVDNDYIIVAGFNSVFPLPATGWTRMYNKTTYALLFELNETTSPRFTLAAEAGGPDFAYSGGASNGPPTDGFLNQFNKTSLAINDTINFTGWSVKGLYCDDDYLYAAMSDWAGGAGQVNLFNNPCPTGPPPPPGITINSVVISPAQLPVPGTAHCSANVTTAGVVANVTFNVTFPNGSSILLGSTNVGGDIYNSSDFNITVVGRHVCTVFANNTNGSAANRSRNFYGGRKGIVPMNAGSPFYTIHQNPRRPADQACLSSTIPGQTCNTTWNVTANAANGTTWQFFCIYESGQSGAANTSRTNITVLGGAPPPPPPPTPSGGGGGGGATRQYPVECIESWTCGSWGECIAGTKRRICTDANNCGTTEKKPVESASCVVPFAELLEKELEEKPAMPSFEEIEKEEHIVEGSTVVVEKPSANPWKEWISGRSFVRGALLALVVSILVYLFFLARHLKKTPVKKRDRITDESFEAAVIAKKAAKPKPKPQPKPRAKPISKESTEELLNELNKL